MNNHSPFTRFLALCIASGVLIAYELSVMRAFSVGSWSNFGAMVISIALLGIGFAGTLLTFVSERIRRDSSRWLAVPALLLGPAMALSYVAAQYVPFNPVMIGVDPIQLLWIGAYYVLYAVPFFIGAVFIGAAFVVLQEHMYRTYFWNMVGSGLGGAVFLGLTYFLPPSHLVEPLVIFSAVVALLCSMRLDQKNGTFRLPLGFSALTALLMVASVALVALGGRISVSEFKPVSYARQFPDTKEVYYSYGPTGEFSVYQSSYFHFAPGLSDNASTNVKSMPENAFLGLYIDGQGPIGIMRALHPAEAAYLDYLPMAAPYTLLNRPSVFLIQLGGGIGVFDALYHGAQMVSVAEPNPTLIHILKDVPFFERYTGNILNDPRVSVYNTDPRAFAANATGRFDLAEIGLIDSVGLSQTGGYGLNENYTYTAEGIDSYLNALNQNGILSITIWNKLDPPRNVPKLLSTVVEALKERHVADPGQHIFAFGSLLSTATILVKNSAFTLADIQTLQQFLRKTSFEAYYYPGMPDPGKDFNAILAAYADEFQTQNASTTPTEPAPKDMYYYTTSWLLNGKADALYNDYLFNIRPATDDRPYYTGYVRPSTLPMVFANMSNLSEEWGYVFEVSTFLLSILFGILIILVPLVGRWQALFEDRKGTLRIVAYYAALGVGYMMVEIYLIQRLVFFLSDPIFSNTIVITAMLLLSGVGALVAGRFSGSPRRLVGYAVLGIAATMLFYIVFLPLLVDSFLGWPLLAKMALSVLFVAPSAFFLGMPFPTGLTALSKNRSNLIPWAWGINGALSVTGATVARLVSISWGFSVVLSLVIALYAIAYIAFSAHQEREKPLQSVYIIPRKIAE